VCAFNTAFTSCSQFTGCGARCAATATPFPGQAYDNYACIDSGAVSGAVASHPTLPACCCIFGFQSTAAHLLLDNTASMPLPEFTSVRMIYAEVSPKYFFLVSGPDSIDRV
jgi:hypothetical protein